jgi:hypothetical protein
MNDMLRTCIEFSHTRNPLASAAVPSEPMGGVT